MNSQRVVEAQVGSNCEVTNELNMADLYQRYAPLVRHIALSVGVSPDDAADIVQATFESAWQQRDRFDAKRAHVRSWLSMIARRRSIDSLRRVHRHYEIPHEVHHIASATTVLAQPTVDQELVVDRLTLASELESLNHRARQAVALSYLEGLSHAEIAETMGTPVGTVKSLVHRGLRQLRQRLSEPDVLAS